MLAQIIALRNRSLSIRQINFAVQQTIDRILFLRLCEDRGIEPYGQLRAISSGDRNYPRLCEIFEKADQKYNSGLFHFYDEPARAEPPDELTLNLNIDDTPIKWILHNLYYPQSPYEFSVLPAEILGNVYEQFLGKVIRLTPGHRAIVDPKPEVKKAGGIYYTPAYIVDYIVKNTVGKLCEGKTPAQISKLKILDPACGSGSFLLGAYTYLLDYHRDWYCKNAPQSYLKKKNPPIYQVASTFRHCEESASDDEAISNYRITVTEKKRILLNNIFGVDIDSQAVEVTKLSLLLKVLEGENQQTLENQYRLFHERALPDLGNNIKCGNSLIGPDFFDSLAASVIASEAKQSLSCHSRESGNLEELRRKINAFDWQAEFPEIFNRPNPGFDAVIGNPPWGGDIDNITEYIEKNYPESTKGYRDTSKLFIDKGMNLTREKGLFSFIVPSAFMFQPRYIDIRKMVTKYHIRTLWNIGDKVFSSKVTAPCCIIVLEKDFSKENPFVLVLDTMHLTDNFARSKIAESPTYREISQSIYDKTTQAAFVTYYRESRDNEIRLEEILDCKDCGIKHQRVGVGMEQKGKSDLAARLYYEGPQQSPGDHRYLIGSDLNSSGWFMDFSEERYFRGNFKDILRKNEIVYFNEHVFNLAQKILWRQTSDRLRATIIGPYWFANTLQAGILRDQNYDLCYVLGLLNSKFLNFIYIESVKESGRVFPQVKLAKVRALPFRRINFDNPDDVAKHDKMVTFVERMLDLHKQLASAKIPDEKTRIQREIDITDKQIDNLVYELYNLTDEEIEVIEQYVK